MPWHLEKRDGKYCVIKNADGEVEGCHGSQAAARRQMAALYASEEKSMGNSITININEPDVDVEEEGQTLKAVWSTAAINDLPDSSFLYIESGGEKDGEGKTKPRSLRHFPYKDASGKIDLPHLRNAIARAPQANLPADVKKRVQGRAQRLLAEANKEDDGWFDGLVERVKEALGLKTKEQEPPGFMLWKEGDTYRWLARYSNNLRDQDSPPEIISAQSHKSFVEMVDKGEADYPELWLWHRPEWKFGKATWLAYDDSGFALAAGTVDRDKESLAYALSKLPADSLRVSHGMPITSIKRDPEDETIIVGHVTREISPLPAWAAANSYTGFQILPTEVNSMAIPKDKRDSLVDEWGLPDELLGRLEQANAEEADKAAQDGVESKEKEAEVEVEEVAETKDEATQDEQPAAEAAEAPPAAEPVTRDELVEAMGALGNAFRVLTEQVGALAGEVKTLKEARTVEEAESLTDIFQRAIGHPATRVDGRTQEAKARPRETKPQGEQVVNSGNLLADSIVNEIVTGSWLDAFRQSQQ